MSIKNMSFKKLIFISFVLIAFLVSSIGIYYALSKSKNNENPINEVEDKEKANKEQEIEENVIDESENNENSEVKKEEQPVDNTKNNENQNNSNSNNTTQPKPITKYTVTFNSNGGSNISSQSISENAYANRPSNPTRIGYIFIGWILNDSVAYNFNIPVTSNIILVANWKLDTTPEWSWQIVDFSTMANCQLEGMNYTDDYVPRCDDVLNSGGVIIGYMLTLKEKNTGNTYNWR